MKFIEFCFVFGSVAKESPKPKDCDILIVSSANQNEENWFYLRGELKAVKESFRQKFEIDLSIVLMTSREYRREIHDFEKRFSPRIVIYNLNGNDEMMGF